MIRVLVASAAREIRGQIKEVLGKQEVEVLGASSAQEAR